MMAPRSGLIIGILVASAVDVYQVLVTQDVKPVSQALAAAQPAAGLPRLQEFVWGTASMGWGDAFLGAARRGGGDLGPQIRLIAAGAVFLLGVASGFMSPRRRHRSGHRARGGRPRAGPGAGTLPVPRHKEERPWPPRRRAVTSGSSSAASGRRARSGRFDVTNPANGEVVGTCRTPRPTTRRARSTRPPRPSGLAEHAGHTRARPLRKLRRPDPERIDEIGALMTLEQGKPLAEVEGRGRVRGQLHGVVRRRGRAHQRADRAAAERGEPASSCRARASASSPRSRRGPPGRDDDPQARPGDGRRAALASSKPASATPLTAAVVLRAIEDSAPTGYRLRSRATPPRRSAASPRRASTMLVQPAAIAGPSLRVIIAAGKFHGVIAATTPMPGAARGRGWPRSAAARSARRCARPRRRTTP